MKQKVQIAFTRRLKTIMRMNKSVVLLLFFATITISCSEENKNVMVRGDYKKHPKSSFMIRDSIKYVGKLKAGTSTSILFYLKCNSDVPLLVKGVDAGCRCTVTNYTRDSVKKGDSACINVVFTADKDLPKAYQKTVMVSTNANRRFIALRFRGEMF